MEGSYTQITSPTSEGVSVEKITIDEKHHQGGSDTTSEGVNVYELSIDANEEDIDLSGIIGEVDEGNPGNQDEEKVKAEDVKADGVDAGDVKAADGVKVDGVKAHDVDADVVKADVAVESDEENVKADDVKAADVKADGVKAHDLDADDVKADVAAESDEENVQADITAESDEDNVKADVAAESGNETEDFDENKEAVEVAVKSQNVQQDEHDIEDLNISIEEELITLEDSDEDGEELEFAAEAENVTKECVVCSDLEIEEDYLEAEKEKPREYTIEDFLKALNDDEDGNTVECDQPSSLTILRQNQEGSMVGRAQPQMRPQPKPSDLYDITLTKDMCCMTEDDDTDVYRTKMPCGHVFCSEMIKDFVTDTLEKKGFIFKCPFENEKEEPCDKVWDYNLVRHVACFSDVEKRKAEKQMGDNYLVCAAKAQRCPKCTIYCVHEQNNVKRVNCGACRHSFCWACLHQWTSSNTTHCANNQCTGLDPRIRYLRENTTKTTISYIDLESYAVRGCPACGFIIHHTSGCKHMICHICRVNFCFVCLGLHHKEKGWPCGNHRAVCVPAPIQTDLPK